MAGISQDALQDETIRKQIYDVIESQGGLDAVKQQVGKRPAAPSPAPPPPPPVANRGGMYLIHIRCLPTVMFIEEKP